MSGLDNVGGCRTRSPRPRYSRTPYTTLYILTERLNVVTFAHIMECVCVYLLVPLLQELNRKLLAAVRGGRTEEVKALLRQGADIECTYWVRHV